MSQVAEQVRRGVANPLERLGNLLTLAQPALRFRFRGAEEPAKFFREILNLAALGRSHSASDWTMKMMLFRDEYRFQREFRRRGGVSVCSEINCRAWWTSAGRYGAIRATNIRRNLY